MQHVGRKKKMAERSGNKQRDGLFKSVMLAYFVLVLHLILMVGLGLLVIFFRGIIQYMLWIFLAGSAAIVGSGYYFYKRMKAEGKTVMQMLKTPLLNGRPIEVSLLGGLASFRVGPHIRNPELDAGGYHAARQIEDPETIRIREITELARLLENNLITREEYDRAKKQLFH
jgi:hypothetical protein